MTLSKQSYSLHKNKISSSRCYCPTAVVATAAASDKYVQQGKRTHAPSSRTSYFAIEIFNELGPIRKAHQSTLSVLLLFPLLLRFSVYCYCFIFMSFNLRFFFLLQHLSYPKLLFLLLLLFSCIRACVLGLFCKIIVFLFYGFEIRVQINKNKVDLFARFALNSGSLSLQTRITRFAVKVTI